MALKYFLIRTYHVSPTIEETRLKWYIKCMEHLRWYIWRDTYGRLVIRTEIESWDPPNAPDVKQNLLSSFIMNSEFVCNCIEFPFYSSLCSGEGKLKIGIRYKGHFQWFTGMYMYIENNLFIWMY